jgi:hypothetical protein
MRRVEIGRVEWEGIAAFCTRSWVQALQVTICGDGDIDRLSSSIVGRTGEAGILHLVEILNVTWSLVVGLYQASIGIH